MTDISLETLRRTTVGRSLRPVANVQAALDSFGFVQADPIRAPARAQDLMLRHRVPGYRAGELEQRYVELRVEETFFINYGFVTPALFDQMHPRGRLSSWSATQRARADALLQYVGERGEVHPKEATAHFAHGRVTNYWGGSSSATTHMLDQLHYLGLIRVARREAGVRVYGLRRADAATELPRATTEIDARIDALVDVLVRKYAPVPERSLTPLIARLRYAVPQWRARLPRAAARARGRLSQARVDGVTWYWPMGETLDGDVGDDVRLLAPFDPVVWDRRRFELLWGWAYRFEAYTPAPKRVLGYYALPLLWRDQVIGWANASVVDEALQVTCGYVGGRPPRDRGFRAALDAECARLESFLGIAARRTPKAKRRT